MADGFTVRLDGIDELKRRLESASHKIRVRAVRSALRKAGQIISKQAKQNAPTLSAPTRNRKVGTVKKAISVRVSKQAKQNGDEGVFVGVRPLKQSKIRAFKVSQARVGKNASGSQNPNDPYYWWWVEFGHKIVKASGDAGFGETVYTQRLRNGVIVTRKARYNKRSITGRRRQSVGYVQGRFFMARAAQTKGNEAVKTFMDSVIPQIEKLNAKGAA